MNIKRRRIQGAVWETCFKQILGCHKNTCLLQPTPREGSFWAPLSLSFASSKVQDKVCSDRWIHTVELIYKTLYLYPLQQITITLWMQTDTRLNQTNTHLHKTRDWCNISVLLWYCKQIILSLQKSIFLARWSMCIQCRLKHASCTIILASVSL